MVKNPFSPFMGEVTEIGDELKVVYAKVDDLKAAENFIRSYSYRMNLSSLPLVFVIFIQNIGRSMCESHRWCSLMVTRACLVIGCIDRGGSKACSSGSLEFRAIYISMLLFRAAYVWIKFRDVIPRGAVYQKPGSNKFEPRIKFPVTRGVGGKSKRIPLGLYNSFAEAEVAYRIAAFYCDKPRHRLDRLDLGGGASFPIPALSVDPDLPYKEKVKQVGDQVLRVYAEFEVQKASMNLLPRVLGLPSGMPIGETQLSASSPIQQLREPLSSEMDSVMQCQGYEFGPNSCNRVDFNNPGSLLLLHTETQHELIGAYKQQEHLRAQVSRTEVENMGWEVKYSELERKYLELERKYLDLERRNLQLEQEIGLLNHRNMQSVLQTQHPEQEFDPDRFLMMGHEESLAR